jgi:uncharacterized protein with NRDE domain
MHWWPKTKEQMPILAGKDLQADGTWLGVNKQGRFSALTNFRQPQFFDKKKQSRGSLVLQALAKKDDDILKHLTECSESYNGFNLVFGQLNKLFCFDSVSQKQQLLPAGFHSLCTGALDDIWPKMALGQAKLANAICKSSDQSLKIDKLFELMKNSQQAQTEHLPNTGLPLDWEQLLSSIFIVSEQYGTRTTSIITQDNEGHICVYDRSYNEKGECIEEQNFSIK